MILTSSRKNNASEPKRLYLKEIAGLIDGKLVGTTGEFVISGVAGIKEAQEGDITFLANAKYLPFLSQTKASAVITAMDISCESKPLIHTKNPSLAFSKVIELFVPTEDTSKSGIHPTAVIGQNVTLGSGVYVGPLAVIEDGVSVAEGCRIEAQSFIGKASILGRDCYIHPKVTLLQKTLLGQRVIIHSGTVIGSDGFGYETVDGKHIKIPQIGFVQIDDDVEIGSNVSIDRGRFSKTWIKKGAKIDNLVQIAHNVIVGENCILVSQCGISGSTEIGNNTIIAGQAGVVGHLNLGENVIVGAGAGVTKDVAANTVVLGSPAKPMIEQKRLFALISRLPELFKEFAELKKKIQ